MLYAFYMEGRLNRGSYRGNRAPEKQRSKRGWVTGSSGQSLLPLAAAGRAALTGSGFPSTSALSSSSVRLSYHRLPRNLR